MVANSLHGLVVNVEIEILSSETLCNVVLSGSQLCKRTCGCNAF